MGGQRIRLSILIIVFSIAALGVRAATNYRIASAPQPPSWTSIPYQIGGWRGIDGHFDPIYGDDPADTSIVRTYQRSDGLPVILYVGFYGHLTEIVQIHSPEICYPAQGWNILPVGKSTTGLYRGREIRAQEILVDKNGDRRLVLWWYNAGDQSFENRIRYFYGLLVLSAFTGRTDGSMVRLEVPIQRADRLEARDRAQAFLNGFLPFLDRSLPR
jgi:EpsI family protein